MYLYSNAKMTTAEFNNARQELIQWIGSLNDSSLLNLLNSIRLSRTKSDNDWWNDLTSDQKKNIELGLKDLNEGKTMSSKEFWKRFRNE